MRLCDYQISWTPFGWKSSKLILLTDCNYLIFVFFSEAALTVHHSQHRKILVSARRSQDYQFFWRRRILDNQGCYYPPTTDGFFLTWNRTQRISLIFFCGLAIWWYDMTHSNVIFEIHDYPMILIKNIAHFWSLKRFKIWKIWNNGWI